MKLLHDERSRDVARCAFERLLELTEATAAFVKRRLAEHGLSRARASVLWVLHHRGPVTQRELSDVVGVTPRNITGLVDALEADGYVLRTRHPSDRRATLVSLTDRGAKTMDNAQAYFGECAFRLFSDVPAQELETFLEVSGRLMARFREPAAPCHDVPGRTSPLS